MKILCIGRNYAAHAAELNNAVPDKPVVFLKPDTALLRHNEPFYYPEFSQDIHYECELVYRVGRAGKYIAPEHAFSYLDGVGLGVDFTARDLQEECKRKGLPWEISKAFNGSAPVSEMLPLETFPDHTQLRFELHQNGQLRQQGQTALMLFPVPQMVSYLSQFFMLRVGDLIFTGTPAGVGPIAVGDVLTGTLEGRPMFEFAVK